MATKSQSPATQPSAPAETPRRPTHRLYRVNGDGKAAIWTPIGAAWPNKDGKGFNIQLDAVPLDGRVTLRLASQAPSRRTSPGGSLPHQWANRPW